MPVTSSCSCVKRWPSADEVLSGLRDWVGREAARRPELLALGYFGSYARGDFGFGSDLDLIAIVRDSPVPRPERIRGWRYEELPVPADLVVYTLVEWRTLERRGAKLPSVVGSEGVWLFGGPVADTGTTG